MDRQTYFELVEFKKSLGRMSLIELRDLMVKLNAAEEQYAQQADFYKRSEKRTQRWLNLVAREREARLGRSFNQRKTKSGNYWFPGLLKTPEQFRYGVWELLRDHRVTKLPAIFYMRSTYRVKDIQLELGEQVEQCRRHRFRVKTIAALVYLLCLGARLLNIDIGRRTYKSFYRFQLRKVEHAERLSSAGRCVQRPAGANPPGYDDKRSTEAQDK